MKNLKGAMHGSTWDSVWRPTHDSVKASDNIFAWSSTWMSVYDFIADYVKDFHNENLNEEFKR